MGHHEPQLRRARALQTETLPRQARTRDFPSLWERCCISVCRWMVHVARAHRGNPAAGGRCPCGGGLVTHSAQQKTGATFARIGSRDPKTAWLRSGPAEECPRPPRLALGDQGARVGRDHAVVGLRSPHTPPDAPRLALPLRHPPLFSLFFCACRRYCFCGVFPHSCTECAGWGFRVHVGDGVPTLVLGGGGYWSELVVETGRFGRGEGALLLRAGECRACAGGSWCGM